MERDRLCAGETNYGIDTFNRGEGVAPKAPLGQKVGFPLATESGKQVDFRRLGTSIGGGGVKFAPPKSGTF